MRGYYDMQMDGSLAQGVLNGVNALGGGVGCLVAARFLAIFSRR